MTTVRSALAPVGQTAGRRAPISLDLHHRAATAASPVHVALLGLGRVGSAVAAAALDPAAALAPRLRIVAALVRDPERPREHALHERVRLTSDPDAVFAADPRVVIEALGGIEPARTLAAEALRRGVAVVTANKSLMAAHGPELMALAARHDVPLRYEASVIAGVPFLGTFARRPIASSIGAISGIVNGTSNFILSKMAEWLECGTALAEAQQLGLAEPDPRSDVDGIDAAEKLTVLIRQFARRNVATSGIETTGLDGVRAADLEHAREFGGAIKPVVYADWTRGALTAFVGPAWVSSRHKLAQVDGVENAVVLHGGAAGALFYSGPGAGPAVTAATILDDVMECVQTGGRSFGESGRHDGSDLITEHAVAPSTGWFVRLAGTPALPTAARISDFLESCGVLVRRVSAGHHHSGRETCYLLTRSCARDRIQRALAALGDRIACEPFCFRTLATPE
jgi:homoserine dehydrogenase